MIDAHHWPTCQMSEKFDGVNATWDGQSLTSRDGNRFAAPAWFTAGLPAIPITGELWAGRGRFERTLGIVRSADAGDAWRAIRFMVFDAPDGLELGPHAEYVAQIPCRTEDEVDAFYEAVLAGGGEGIMLRDADGQCQKRKPFADDDAEVIGYRPRRGQNAGRVGALCVRDAAGREFALGSGLSHEDREAPPPLGAIVKFTYQGRTARGKPRFASYLAPRAETVFV